jgi:hypothetical protein
MICPKCDETMTVSRESYTTRNSNPPNRGRHLYYDHHQYHCENCDVWLSLEIPQVGSETEVSARIA